MNTDSTVSKRKSNPLAASAIAIPVTGIVTIFILMLTTVFAAGGWAVTTHNLSMITSRHEAQIDVLDDSLNDINTRLTVIELSVQKTEHIVESLQRNGGGNE